jgi:hypothetical protein
MLKTWTKGLYRGMVVDCTRDTLHPCQNLLKIFHPKINLKDQTIEIQITCMKTINNPVFICKSNHRFKRPKDATLAPKVRDNPHVTPLRGVIPKVQMLRPADALNHQRSCNYLHLWNTTDRGCTKPLFKVF